MSIIIYQQFKFTHCVLFTIFKLSTHNYSISAPAFYYQLFKGIKNQVKFKSLLESIKANFSS